MSIFSFFKPAPHIRQIKNKAIVKKKYRYWRIRTFYTMYVGYAFFYFTRKSFTFAMPAMITDLGFDKAQLGMLGSILSISYGVSKFVSGIMSDRSNPRYFMAIGLILTGIFNIFFGLSSLFVLFAIFWGLNGWFQGWGWPPIAKLLTHWYAHSERGSWWSMWNTSHNLGGAIIPIVVGVIIQHMGWRFAMYIPGAVCILVGLFIVNRLRDTPQSLGLPPIEKYKHDRADARLADSEKLKLSTKEILIDYVLKNKYIWILALSYFFVYIIRTAFNDWTPLFLIETKNYTRLAANSTIFWFEGGGFLGSLVAGWSSDWIFKGRRGPVNVIYTLCVLGIIYAIWNASSYGLIFDSFLLFCIGFFIFGPQMLIGVAAAELSHKKAAGTATGFVGTFAYAGAAFAGWPLGKIATNFGWQGFFIVLAVCGIIALLFLAPLWSVSVNKRRIKTKK